MRAAHQQQHITFLPGAGAPQGGWSHPHPRRVKHSPVTSVTGHRSSWVVTPELLLKEQQRWPKSPGLLHKKEGEGAVEFSALLFLPVFIKYKIHSLCSQQSKSTVSSSKVGLSNPSLPEVWWEHHKTVSVLERGTAELCLHSLAPKGFAVCWVTLEQPYQLLHVTLCHWSCPGRKAQSGDRPGHKSCCLDTRGAQSQGHWHCFWGTRGSPAAESWGTGISFLCRGQAGTWGGIIRGKLSIHTH